MSTSFIRAVNFMRLWQIAFFHVSVIFLFTGTLSAQIIYTDINDTILTFPPQTPGILDDSTNFFYFDLNQDGADDFYFSAHYWEEWYSPSASEYPHWVINLSSLSSPGVPWEEACAIDYGQGDTVQWYQWGMSAALYVDVLGFSTACNLPFEDRYFGLRLQQGNDNYYGWIRMDAATDTLVFKDFAYNSVADGIILAGQTSTTGEYEPITVETGVWYDGRVLHLPPGNHFDRYLIINSAGHIIKQAAIGSRSEINLENLKPGVFIIRLLGKMQQKTFRFAII